jgi:hypothetical protein
MGPGRQATMIRPSSPRLRAAYQPPAAGRPLADLQAVWVDTAEWLSREECRFFSAYPFGIGKNQVTGRRQPSTMLMRTMPAACKSRVKRS